jgi:hypothetical protein
MIINVRGQKLPAWDKEDQTVAVVAQPLDTHDIECSCPEIAISVHAPAQIGIETFR